MEGTGCAVDLPIDNHPIISRNTIIGSSNAPDNSSVLTIITFLGESVLILTDR